MLAEFNHWLGAEEFLRNFWQKKPVLLRGVLPAAEGLLSPDELAGLSCLPGVEARIVREQGLKKPWELSHGPFSEASFAELPPKAWTLLVQRVDRLAASVAELVEHVAFIPNWRLDDVMVSYAVDGGSVGPHTDQYDVFLVQGMGRRQWQLSLKSDLHGPHLEGLDLRILADFKPDLTVEVGAGDVLYLPPGLAHYGRALGEAMTYSIGFRAPAYRDLLLSYASELFEKLSPSELYSDANLRLQDEVGEISPAALKQLENELLSKMFAGDHFKRWFGRYMTALHSIQGEEAEPLDFPGRPSDFRRREGGRFVFVQGEKELYLFVEGEEWVLSHSLRPFVAKLCRQQTFFSSEIQGFIKEPAALRLWEELLAAAYIFEVDDR